MVLFAGMLLVAGCTAHQPPDDVVTVAVKVGVTQTITAMAMPADQQPGGRTLDDQSRLLACRLSADRVQQIQSGLLDREAMVEGYNNALKRRAAKKSVAQAPTMLIFLIEKIPAWSAEQKLLAAALLTQFEQEAKLEIPPKGLE